MPAAKAIVAGRCVSSTSGPCAVSRSTTTVAAGIGTAGSGRHDAQKASRYAHSQWPRSYLPVPVRVADEAEGQVEALRGDVGRPRVEGHPGPTLLACAVQARHGQGAPDAETLRGRIDRQHADARLAVPLELGHRVVRPGDIGDAAKQPSIGSDRDEHGAGGRPSGDVAQLVTVVVAQLVPVALVCLERDPAQRVVFGGLDRADREIGRGRRRGRVRRHAPAPRAGRAGCPRRSPASCR